MTSMTPISELVRPFTVGFPDELCQTPRNWAERAYPNLIHYTKVEKGGHFAAREHPELFTKERRAGFKPLRELAV